MSEQTLRDTHHSLSANQNVLDKNEYSSDDKKYCLQRIREGLAASAFAQPAVLAVFGSGSEAKFLDDFLWNHIGDPVVTNRKKAKSPRESDGLSNYLYDYDKTLINGYTDTGTLLNVRETYDPAAREQERYMVIIGDMTTLEVARYRINAIEASCSQRTMDVVKKLILTTDTFDSIDGITPYDEANSAEALFLLNESAVAKRRRHEQQAYLSLSQRSSYKPFGGEKQSIGNIDRVVRDRHLLSQLAATAGVTRAEHGGIEIPPSYLLSRAA